MPLQSCVDRILSKYDEYKGEWESLINLFNEFYTSFEANHIILNKFNGIYSYVLSEYRKLGEKQVKLIDIYFKITSVVIAKLPVSNILIENFKIQEKEFQEKMMDLDIFMNDFMKELQNKYLSRMFNYKIPIRVTADKDVFPVLTLKNNNKKSNNKIIKQKKM